MRIIKIVGLILFVGLYLGNAQERKPELVVQTGHSRVINSIVFSPDGKTLASGSYDKTVKLWDVQSRQELRTLMAENTGVVNSVVMSPDGKITAAASNDDVINLWDTVSGKEIKTLKGHISFVKSIAFSPNGKMLASGSSDKTVKLWDIDSGQEIKNIEANFSQAGSVAFSPDGKTLAFSTYDQMIKFWDIGLGQEIRTFEGNDLIAFSPDGKILASQSRLALNDAGKYYRKIKLWDIASGQELGSISNIDSITFSPDGKTLAIEDLKTIRLWDIASGQELKILSRPTLEHKQKLLEGNSDKIESYVFSPDGKTLAAAIDDSIILWDISSGKEIGSLGGQTAFVNRIKISPDGKKLASSGLQNNVIKLWDLTKDKNPISLEGNGSSIAFSSDSQMAASVIGNTVRLWDAVSGKELKTFAGHTEPVSSISFSPDDKILASGSYDKTVKLWDVASGQELQTLAGHHGHIFKVGFLPDGKTIVSASMSENINDAIVKLWNGVSGKEKKSFEYNKTSEIYKPASPEQIALYIALTDGLEEPVTLDGKFLFKVGENGKLNLYDRYKNKLLASLMSFSENDWSVVTPDGLFDGTPKGWKQLIWRFDNNTFDYTLVEAYFKEFYYPGLLQDIMQGKTPLPPDKDLSAIDIRQPTVKITSIDEKPIDSTIDGSTANKTVNVKIEITDNINKGRRDFPENSSGANDLRLFRNGSLVHLWKKKGMANENPASIFDLSTEDGCKQISATKDAPRKAVCETEVEITAGENNFTAYGFNHDNVKSNDTNALVVGAESLKRKGKLRILAVGVDKYKNDKYDLKFAVKDAIDFGVELRKEQTKLANLDTPEVVQLTDAEATKQNILYALERFAKGKAAIKPEKVSAAIEKKLFAIEKTQPEDVLVIYFAGHGTASKDRFYLIPNDGFPTEEMNEESRIATLRKQSISDLELEAVFRDLDASQILFVIDACNSGQALEAEEKRRGPMNSKGLAQLAYEKGMYILTAAQSYQAALEVARTPTGKSIEHGLLTYSLLEGLNTAKADADENKQITEREWFNFAVQTVPQIQLEEMKQRSADRGSTKRSDLIFVNGDDPNATPENRALQTPRVFYRRETAGNPFIIAKP